MSSLTKNPINGASDFDDNYTGDSWKPGFISSNANDGYIRTDQYKQGSTPVYQFTRATLIFDTSSIPDDAVIISAKLRLYCQSRTNGLGNGAVYVVPSDGNHGYTMTNLAVLTYAQMTTSAYNEFILSDFTNISKTGNTNLGIVEYYDFVNSAPSSNNSNTFHFDAYEQTNKPELVITYAVLPTVTTTSATNILARTADSGGNVTDAGGGTISERGVCYNTTGTPTTSDTKQTASGTTGSFTSNLTGLLPNTKYYLRAYAINEAGTSYGSEINFTTSGEGGILAALI